MATYPTRQHVRVCDAAFRRCVTEKRGYPTREAALVIAELQMLKGLVHRGCHLMPYQCDQCAEWHLANRRIYFPPLKEGPIYDTHSS